MTVAAEPARALIDRVDILPWHDPVVDRVGHDPRDPYVEQFWLPVLGPASVLLLRHLAGRFDAEPDGFELDVETCARTLGLGVGLGRWGPMQRTLTRCVTFGMARRWGERRVLVRRSVPPLARHHVVRLPAELQRRHEALLEAALGQPPPAGRSTVQLSADGGRKRSASSTSRRTP